MASAAASTQPLSTTLTLGGMQGLTSLADKYAGNETLGGLAVGSLADVYKTQANTGLSLAYNNAFLESYGQYQGALADKNAANALSLLNAELAGQRDLYNIQGQYAIKGKQLDLEGTKYTADKTAQSYMYGADRQAQASMYGADKSAQASMYGADKSAQASMYGADRSYDATRVAAELDLEGTKYTADSAERQIGLKGQQDRLTLQQKTNEDKELRRDARNAIRTQGGRFYG